MKAKLFRPDRDQFPGWFHVLGTQVRVGLSRRWRDVCEIARDKPVYKFDDAFSSHTLGHAVGVLFQNGQSIGYRKTAAAEIQESMIVLSIANADHVLGKTADFEQPRRKSGCLVHR